jgi:hypothetical protein
LRLINAGRPLPGDALLCSHRQQRKPAMSLRRGIYIVPTHRWYIERSVWLVAGVVLLAATGAAALHHPLWVLAVVATGIVSINVAFTGFCPVGNVLARCGFVPMLARPDWAPGR